MLGHFYDEIGNLERITAYVCASAKFVGMVIGLILYMVILYKSRQHASIHRVKKRLILPIYRPAMFFIQVVLFCHMVLYCVLATLDRRSDIMKVILWVLYEILCEGFTLILLQVNVSYTAQLRAAIGIFAWMSYGAALGYLHARSIGIDPFLWEAIFHFVPALFHLYTALPLSLFNGIRKRPTVRAYSTWMYILRLFMALFYLFQYLTYNVEVIPPSLKWIAVILLSFVAILELPFSIIFYSVLRADTVYWHQGGKYLSRGLRKHGAHVDHKNMEALSLDVGSFLLDVDSDFQSNADQIPHHHQQQQQQQQQQEQAFDLRSSHPYGHLSPLTALSASPPVGSLMDASSPISTMFVGSRPSQYAPPSLHPLPLGVSPSPSQCSSTPSSTYSIAGTGFPTPPHSPSSPRPQQPVMYDDDSQLLSLSYIKMNPEEKHIADRIVQQYLSINSQTAPIAEKKNPQNNVNPASSKAKGGSLLQQEHQPITLQDGDDALLVQAPIPSSIPRSDVSGNWSRPEGDMLLDNLNHAHAHAQHQTRSNRAPSYHSPNLSSSKSSQHGPLGAAIGLLSSFQSRNNSVMSQNMLTDESSDSLFSPAKGLVPSSSNLSTLGHEENDHQFVTIQDLGPPPSLTAFHSSPTQPRSTAAGGTGMLSDAVRKQPHGIYLDQETGLDSIHESTGSYTTTSTSTETETQPVMTIVTHSDEILEPLLVSPPSDGIDMNDDNHQQHHLRQSDGGILPPPLSSSHHDYADYSSNEDDMSIPMDYPLPQFTSYYHHMPSDDSSSTSSRSVSSAYTGLSYYSYKNKGIMQQFYEMNHIHKLELLDPRQKEGCLRFACCSFYCLDLVSRGLLSLLYADDDADFDLQEADGVLGRVDLCVLSDANDNIVQGELQELIESNKSHLVDYTLLTIDHHRILGQGAFSKVFGGYLELNAKQLSERKKYVATSKHTCIPLANAIVMRYHAQHRYTYRQQQHLSPNVYIRLKQTDPRLLSSLSRHLFMGVYQDHPKSRSYTLYKEHCKALGMKPSASLASYSIYRHTDTISAYDTLGLWDREFMIWSILHTHQFVMSANDGSIDPFPGCGGGPSTVSGGGRNGRIFHHLSRLENVTDDDIYSPRNLLLALRDKLSDNSLSIASYIGVAAAPLASMLRNTNVKMQQALLHQVAKELLTGHHSDLTSPPLSSSSDSRVNVTSQQQQQQQQQPQMSMKQAMRISSALLGSSLQILNRTLTVACKFFLRAAELNGATVQAFSRETLLHASLKHTNIVWLYGLCVAPPAIAIISEECSKGSLMALIEQQLKYRTAYIKELIICHLYRIRILAEFDRLEGLLVQHPAEPVSIHDTNDRNIPIQSSHSSVSQPSQASSSSSSPSASMSPTDQVMYQPDFVSDPYLVPQYHQHLLNAYYRSQSRLVQLLSLHWSIRNRLCLAKDAAAGVAYIHKHRILHRDIKTPNYLVTRDLRVKLTDFGISRRIITPYEAYYQHQHITAERCYNNPTYLDGKSMTEFTTWYDPKYHPHPRTRKKTKMPAISPPIKMMTSDSSLSRQDSLQYASSSSSSLTDVHHPTAISASNTINGPGSLNNDSFTSGNHDDADSDNTLDYINSHSSITSSHNVKILSSSSSVSPSSSSHMSPSKTKDSGDNDDDWLVIDTFPQGDLSQVDYITAYLGQSLPGLLSLDPLGPAITTPHAVDTAFTFVSNTLSFVDAEHLTRSNYIRVDFKNAELILHEFRSDPHKYLLVLPDSISITEHQHHHSHHQQQQQQRSTHTSINNATPQDTTQLDIPLSSPLYSPPIHTSLFANGKLPFPLVFSREFLDACCCTLSSSVTPALATQLQVDCHDTILEAVQHAKSVLFPSSSEDNEDSNSPAAHGALQASSSLLLSGSFAMNAAQQYSEYKTLVTRGNSSLKPSQMSLDEQLTTNIGTATWMAPEVIEKPPATGSPSHQMDQLGQNTDDLSLPTQIPQGYSYPADIYSLGVVLYEIICLQPPPTTSSPVVVSPPSSPTRPAPAATAAQPQPFRFHFPSDVPFYIQQLILACLSYDPVKRPSASEVVAVLTLTIEMIDAYYLYGEY